eukprot:749282-Hanusia_phi.AAC.6
MQQTKISTKTARQAQGITTALIFWQLTISKGEDVATWESSRSTSQRDRLESWWREGGTGDGSREQAQGMKEREEREGKRGYPTE